MMPAFGGSNPALADGFDLASGFVLPARLAMRIRDALAGGAETLVVGCCRIDNLATLVHHNRGHALRVLLHVGDLLRESLPFAHTLARSDVDEFCFVLPNPGDDPDASARRIAARVGRQLSLDLSVHFPCTVELVFGFAQAPRDGADADVLLRAARQPRLRLKPPA